MGSARFTMDKAGIGLLLKSDGVKAAMVGRAERIAARFEQIAPVGDPATDPHSGEYRDSGEVTSTNEGGAKRDRATASFTATDPRARYIEYVPDRHGIAHHTVLRATIETGDT